MLEKNFIYFSTLPRLERDTEIRLTGTRLFPVVLNRYSDRLGSFTKLQQDCLLGLYAVLPTLHAATPETCSFFLPQPVATPFPDLALVVRVSGGSR